MTFLFGKQVEGAWRKEFHHDNADNSNTGSMPLVLDKEQAVEEEEKAWHCPGQSVPENIIIFGYSEVESERFKKKN